MADEPELLPEARPFADRVWSRPWMAVFLHALSLQPNVTAAASTAGLTRQGARLAAQRDPEFAQAWKDAVQMGLDLMERIGYQRATTGQPTSETRQRVKRALNEHGELVVVEDETTTITGVHISDGLLARYLGAYRPERFSPHLDVFVRGPSPQEPPMDEAKVDDEVFRMPDPERALALARAIVEAAAQDQIELNPDDVIELGDDSAFEMDE